MEAGSLTCTSVPAGTEMNSTDNSKNVCTFNMKFLYFGKV